MYDKQTFINAIAVMSDELNNIPEYLGYGNSTYESSNWNHRISDSSGSNRFEFRWHMPIDECNISRTAFT